MYSDIEYSRVLMKAITADVKKHDATIDLRQAWVWKAGRDHWEFHYRKFYWHGRASDAYEAKTNGWSAWLAAQGVQGYQLEESAHV